MDIEFTSLEQLYNRLRPALTAKASEMKKSGYSYIKEEDIWNYLKEVKWINSKNLLLFEMVQDVLNAENSIIDDYLKQKLNSNDRKIYFNE